MIGPLFSRAGNRSRCEKGELINAVLYFVDNGCKWRDMPPRFFAIHNSGGTGTDTQDETQAAATQALTHKA